MNKCFFLVLGCCFVGVFLEAGSKSQFLIQSNTNKKISKNTLKENIGEELKTALHTCASITSELGVLQQEVASLQRRLLSRVEKLVENNRCFKKAKRSELSQALTIMSGVKNQLQAQRSNVKQLASKINKNVCLKG